ncbi:hypothetical protein DPEC_G00184870 [Dallia pectoralis]|uniref:Uncharacterized protein n=1 Tax=Dallia pectoralis TaxID=75939 RepID=A0ACC2GB05_DALPE|nr:hypothetical protein DPEC_G00184870 [Dallia pectoralis]
MAPAYEPKVTCLPVDRGRVKNETACQTKHERERDRESAEEVQSSRPCSVCVPRIIDRVGAFSGDFFTGTRSERLSSRLTLSPSPRRPCH